MFKLVLFLLLLTGTISFSCNPKKKKDYVDNGVALPVDKIVIKDTIFVIDTICPEPIKPDISHINDSLMFLYIKKRNEALIEKIKTNKGIKFSSSEIDKFKNY